MIFEIGDMISNLEKIREFKTSFYLMLNILSKGELPLGDEVGLYVFIERER